MRRLVITAAVLACTTSAHAAGRPLSVELDHTARLQLAGPAGSVIVGNPAIADVTVVDERTLFVSGRGFGTTEIVVLDRLGRTIHQGEVVVTGAVGGQVTVYRGATATEMACASTCATSVRSGQGGSSAGAAGGASSSPTAIAPTPAGPIT